MGDRSAPVAEDDPPPVQVVGAELHQDAVLGEDLDVVLPDLPADVREYPVAVAEFDPEVGVPEALHDGALHLETACFSGHGQALPVVSSRVRPVRSPSSSNRAIAAE